MKMKSFVSLVAFLCALTASPALAADPVSLEGSVEVERTVVDNGENRTEFVAPDRIVPGDTLRFSTSYRNDSGQLVENFIVTSPVPAAVMVTLESASDLVVSVDGGTTWGRIEELSMTSAAGSVRSAIPSDITHIRWVIPAIQSDESGNVTYFATVR